MKAKNLMIPLQEQLSPYTTILEAAQRLQTAKRDEQNIGVKGLPVIDDKGVMVGFLSIGDILKAVFPPYMELMELGFYTWNGMIEDPGTENRRTPGLRDDDH